jgi:hypothetical protein
VKKPSQMVDDMLALGEHDWYPPILPFLEPTGGVKDWRRQYERLMQHHQLETDTLLAVIREMRRRIKEHELGAPPWVHRGRA